MAGGENLDVLVVGGGGREFEIGRSIGLSSPDLRIGFLPGNGGTSELPGGVNIPDIAPTNSNAVEALIEQRGVELTIIGSENHIVTGLPDVLRRGGHLVFAPSSRAASLESSKSWGIEFMRKYHVPHPDSFFADTPTQADSYIDVNDPTSFVEKADGLAAGKGVDTFEEVDQSPDRLREIQRAKAYAMLSGEILGGAGKRVVFQNKETGPEASVVVFFDGQERIVLPVTQDHKRLKKGDTGEMTGGVGAIAPLPLSIIDRNMMRQIEDTIVDPSIEGLIEENHLNNDFEYKGALYIGIILTPEGPKVLEYNVRLGDPETQVQLPVMATAGVDLRELFYSIADGDLNPQLYPRTYHFLGLKALSVVVSAEGYPSQPMTGDVIKGLDKNYPGVIVQHAGTKRELDGVVKTSGGRVLASTSVASTFDEAAANVETSLGVENDGIYFDGMQWRDDIGWQVRSQVS